MANPLQKITARAKQLKRKHPNAKWASLIKQASREYRGGKIGAAKSKKKPYRQTGSSAKHYDEMRSARPPGPRIPAGGRKVTYIERRKNRSDVPGKLTGVSAATLKTELKNRLKDSLGKQLVRRELSTTKREKKKIGKQIMQTKQQLRKLQ